MAIALRSVASVGTSATATSAACNKPAGTSAGDVLVASVETRRESHSGVITAPAGWVERVAINDEGTIAHNHRLYTLVAGGAEPASYTWTHATAASAWAIVISCWTGVDNATVVGATASTSDTTNDTSITSGGITTTAANSVVITSYAVNEGASPTRIPLTLHASQTKAAEVNSTVSAVSMGVCQAYEARAATGATGARDATTAGGLSQSTSLVIELLEDTTGAGSGVLLFLHNLT